MTATPVSRAAAVAFALLLTAPAAARDRDAGVAPSPVAILSTRVLVQPGATLLDNGVFTGEQGVGGIALTFVDRTPRPIRDVVLRATYDGSAAVVRDAGTFSPGVRIDRTYALFTQRTAAANSDVRVDVLAVRFLDGATWTRDAEPRLSGGREP